MYKLCGELHFFQSFFLYYSTSKLLYLRFFKKRNVNFGSFIHYSKIYH